MARVETAGDVSAFDGHLDAHISVARAFSLHVAQCGESLFERAARRNRGPRCAKRQRILKQLNVVSALGWVFALQKDVGVRVNQSGKNGSPGEIDERGAGWEI